MTGFRAHALDGAMLFFDRATGTNVRVENLATAHVRREAPRVVMFGLTNACNLRCDFCSRDLDRASRWTVDSAATILEDLARAGTLEVAFGGGEPFAFRGFGELVARLRATTDLAIHVTTNGTLLGDASSAIAFDQVRLSIYEGWRDAAQKLVGKRWGANVLVDNDGLAALPSLLVELAALGATDVSLLSYVGPDPERHLTAPGLESVVKASPIPCRVSVCFGARMPRLFGGDCGAGLDFVTLTTDRRMQSCSFQDESHPVDSAADVLALWRRRVLDAPSSRAGCMRSAPPTDTSGIRIWRGFSGNNSGECILVARFAEIADAETLLADLMPGFTPSKSYPAPWLELFAREKLAQRGLEHRFAPDEITTLGRTFVAWTEMAPGDDFPELRALAWKRGASVRPGGVHIHGDVPTLFAIRGTDVRDVAAILRRAKKEKAIARRHGTRVIGALHRTPISAAKEALLRIAAGRPLAVELFDDAVTESDLTDVLKREGGRTAKTKPRLAAYFGSNAETAHAFAEEADAPEMRGLVLIEGIVRRKRLAVRAYQKGGAVAALEGEVIIVRGSFSRSEVPRTKGKKTPALGPLDLARLRREIELRVRTMIADLDVDFASWGGGARASVNLKTATPVPVLSALNAVAEQEGLMLSLGVQDVDPLGKAVARLLADLKATSSV